MCSDTINTIKATTMNNDIVDKVYRALRRYYNEGGRPATALFLGRDIQKQVVNAINVSYHNETITQELFGIKVYNAEMGIIGVGHVIEVGGENNE